MLHLIPSVLQRFAAPCEAQGISIVPTWYKYLDSETLEGKCTPLFVVPDDIGKVLLAIFEIVLYVGGVVAVMFVVYGGFLYLTSTGEPDKAKNARTTIINALVGLAITVLATAIVNLVGRNLAG